MSEEIGFFSLRTTSHTPLKYTFPYHQKVSTKWQARSGKPKSDKDNPFFGCDSWIYAHSPNSFKSSRFMVYSPYGYSKVNVVVAPRNIFFLWLGDGMTAHGNKDKEGIERSTLLRNERNGRSILGY